MEIFNDFLTILDQVIERLNNQKESIIETSNPQKRDLEHKISSFQQLIDNPSNYDLLLNSGIKNKQLLTEQEYANVECIFMISQIANTVPEDYQVEIKSLATKLVQKFDNELQELSNINDSEISEISEKIAQIEKLREKVQINQNLSREDLEQIVKICQEEEIGNNFITHLIMHLTLSSMSQLYQQASIMDQSEIETEIIDENVEPLTIEQMKEVFASDRRKYKYDYTIFSDACQKKLQQFGDLKNIEAILDVLDQFDIDMNRQYKGKMVLETVSPYLTKILLYSNADRALKILNISASRGINSTNIKSMVELLKGCGAFYPRKRRYLKKKNKGPGGGTKGDNITGAFDDFPKNIELIFNIYRQLKLAENIDDNNLFDDFADEIYNKKSEFFTGPYDKHVETIKIYDAYNIPKDQYITSLSSFETVNFSDKLDKFLEIDCFDYIRDNLTKLLSWKPYQYTDLFTILKQELNLSNDEIFSPSNRNVLGQSKKQKTLRKKEMDELLKANGITNNLMAHFHRFQPDEAEQKKFNLLESIVGKEYDELESNFFSNINSRIEYLSMLTEQLPFFSEFNQKYQDSDNELVYRIDGVLVSKYKVYRIYDILIQHKQADSLDTLLYALTRNSDYTQKQYETIKQTLKKQFGEGEMTR